MLRPADDAVWLAQGAGGPLNGDDVELSVDVPDGCSLRLRAVASTLVLPSATGGVARITVRARVGTGALLELLLEPVVVADCANVELLTDVDLADGARLLWREEVVLGRHGELGGDVSTRVDVTRSGEPLLRTGTQVSGRSRAARGPAMLGGARAFGSLLCTDALVPGPPTPGRDEALLSLGGGGWLLSAVATSAVTLRRALDRPLAAVSA